MQEVRVPVVFDDRQRRVSQPARESAHQRQSDGGLYVRDGLMRSGDVIIDFEPQIASRREGMALSDDGILARLLQTTLLRNIWRKAT